MGLAVSLRVVEPDLDDVDALIEAAMAIVDDLQRNVIFFVPGERRDAAQQRLRALDAAIVKVRGR